MSEYWVFDGRQHLFAQNIAREERIEGLEEALQNQRVFLEALEKTLRSRDANLAAVVGNHLRSIQGESREREERVR